MSVTEQDINHFMIAIQATLMAARNAGWPVEKIVEKAHEAIDEFEVEEEENDASG